MQVNEADNRAVEWAIKEDLLANSLTEFDAEEAYRDIRNDGFEEGLAQGASQKAIEDAENLLREGISIETISKCIGLPMEQLQEIYESNITN